MANIERFISAQEQDYATALQEVKNGRKQGHWIWYIFPQIAGLGASSTSQYYAIADLNEAKEYLANPTLRARLTEISTALLELSTDNVESVFGYLDAMKVKSAISLPVLSVLSYQPAFWSWGCIISAYLLIILFPDSSTETPLPLSFTGSSWQVFLKSADGISF